LLVITSFNFSSLISFKSNNKKEKLKYILNNVSFYNILITTSDNNDSNYLLNFLKCKYQDADSLCIFINSNKTWTNILCMSHIFFFVEKDGARRVE